MTTPAPHDLHERVFAAIVKERHRNPRFAVVMDQLGFFTACDFIDGIVDAITTAGAAPPAAVCPVHGTPCTFDPGEPLGRT